MKYEKLFKRALLTEDDDPINMSPENQELSDEEAWNENNPEISENPELKKSFETEPKPDFDSDINSPGSEQTYANEIRAWISTLDQATKTLKDITRFGTSLVEPNKPGVEIFKNLKKTLDTAKQNLDNVIISLEDIPDKIADEIVRANADKKKELNKIKNM